MSEVTITDVPTVVPFSIYVGDTFTRDVSITEDSALVDISADTITMRFSGFSGTLVDLSIGSGISHVSTGVFRFTLSAAQTATISANSEIRADAQWTRASDGRVKTLFVLVGTAIKDVTPA